MKKFLLAGLLALAAISSTADQILRQDKDYLLLRDDAGCPDDIKALISPDQAGRFRSAEAVINGKKFRGCYVHAQGAYYVIYEDGDFGIIPEDLFNQVTSTSL